jgi:hypothetical protein
MGYKGYFVSTYLLRGKGWREGGEEMMIARCKICSKIEVENKLLVPKFDSFIKHSSLKKCIIVKPIMVVGAYYVNPNNAHVKNEKLYVSIRHDTSTSKARKAKNKKKYVQFIAIWHLLKQGHPTIDFENFLLFEQMLMCMSCKQWQIKNPCSCVCLVNNGKLKAIPLYNGSLFSIDKSFDYFG